MTAMNLSQQDTDRIYVLFDELTQKTKEFYMTLLEQNSSISPSHLLEQSADVILNQLKQQSNVRKRNIKVSEDEMYVKPQEIAIGLRWERTKVKRKGRKIWAPRLIQSTFQFVSIVDTLRVLFNSKEFRDTYFEYNLNKDHKCTEGIFSDYCCGSAFNTEFFKENQSCVKIQLYCDEFELCNPLQSKAGVHKILGVYFSIRNMPTEVRLRLNNIYLVCLVNSNDLKTKTTDYNNVWRPIVRELQYLEEVGIDVDGKNIKGTLSHISTDNYGANESLGFAASFSAAYYCRFCLLSKVECQSTTTIDCNMYRKRLDYENQLEIIENSDKVVFAEPKGLKYYCVLNDLQNFHLIDNPTCDVTHDHNEGSIPHLLKSFFELCIKSKCFEADQLNFMFQFHEYGWLNRKNIPSQIHMDKRSLGQNASQSICLFRHLPFVLHQFKNVPVLNSIWKCIQNLLKFLVIVYSHELSEKDLNRLDSITTQFLDQFLECTKAHLIPKLHFMLHYADIIRLVGPVVHMSTIRYEAKHQVFKRLAKKTNNFRNINKTLATKHQHHMCANGYSIHDEIEHTKLKSVKPKIINEYRKYLTNFESSFENLMEIEWLRYNGFEYRENILIIHEGTFYSIRKIFVMEDKYYFLSLPYEILYFDDFLNSYCVDEMHNSTFSLLEYAVLKYKKSFEIKWFGEQKFIIEECLDIRKLCNLNNQ